ncbi:chloramphenicol resistance protein [Nocardia sputorum]|uniref:Cmx/CmrA family chloramphenicol efflux MFS transporter n=1 Tax=Nocardia sputorum TaxID=2984338 RepID=UPI0024928F24|nr:Cmx/CmrA family chloramphenicol efflux MFS transporter [Nocardia sputorum]BDT96207.1 chloramphenicol resistance protein [Nocardia sputorum]
MPIVVFVLAVAVFAQGTSEFMVSGLLERIAVDLGVSLGTAGLLTSLFAAGMVLGAPVMAMAAGRLPVRQSLAAFLALFCVTHVAGAMTSDFAVLLTTRVVAAVTNAGFLALALAALPRLVDPAMVGRATSVVVSGVTVACIAGVPAGTLLGQAWDWRAAFWAVAVISGAAVIPVWTMAPRAVEAGDRPTTQLWKEWAVLGTRPVRIAVLVAILVNAATFAGFTFLGSITAGLGEAGGRWVPGVLALFGLGSFVGVTFTGRYSDRHRERLVTLGTSGLVVVWLLAALTAHTLPGVAIMAAVSGAVAFGVGSTLITTIVQTAAPAAPRIAGALATTAFNIGAVVGPAVAAVVVDHTGEPAKALWCGTVFTIAAVTVVRVSGRPVPSPAAAATTGDPVE